MPEYINGVEQGAAGYTDAEALAAAVQAGVITDGVTKAPTHDAVFDVKATADAAQTAAEVDADVATHAALTTGVHGAGANTILYSDHSANTTTAHGAVSAATASKIVVRDAEGQAKFAAPAEAGDALIKGTALTITEMAALTTGKIWQGAANRPSEVDMPAGEATTFEVLDGHGDVGTGADQVAVGNHTHTLQDDLTDAIQGSGGTYYGNWWTIGRQQWTVAALSEQVIATADNTFASTSRAFATFIVAITSASINRSKVRLYMGGVQVAESSYIAQAVINGAIDWIILTGTRALSGLQTVMGAVYNYSASSTDGIRIGTRGNVDTSPQNTQLSELVIGSIKI